MCDFMSLSTTSPIAWQLNSSKSKMVAAFVWKTNSMKKYNFCLEKINRFLDVNECK